MRAGLGVPWRKIASGTATCSLCKEQDVGANQTQRLTGSGVLCMNGTKNVTFDVVYDMLLTRSQESSGKQKAEARVLHLAAENDHMVPDGDFCMKELPGYRFLNFQGSWTVVCSA